MADVAFGSTETDALKAEMIAAVVQRELIEAGKLTARATDVSSFCVPGEKSISFPKAGSLTVTNRTEGTAGSAAVLTYGTDKMDLSFNAYVAWIVDYKSAIQSSINVQLDQAARAARAHAAYLDTQLLAVMESAGQATTTAGVISYAIILEMMEKYLQNQGRQDLSSGTLTVGTDSWAKLMDMDEFKRAEVYGSAVIPTGLIGAIHGVGVVVSSKVAPSSFYLHDKDALMYGLQAGPSYSEQGANEYGSQAKRAVLDQIFGVHAGFVAQLGAAAGKSALILKDNN